MNTMKTGILLTALTLFFIWIGGMLGGSSGMTIALLIALGMNFFAYWFSDKMILKMYKAQEVSETQAPELYSIVRRLAGRAELPMPKVYVIHEGQPNAFATGRNPDHAAVAVTTGLMDILSYDELAGVIAHELAHIKHRDILIGTIAATIAGAISYIAQMAQWAMIFGGRDEEEGENPIVAFVMMIVAPIAAMLIQMAISRSREYHADRGAALLTGNARHLSGALRKLHSASERLQPMHASPSTSHLFIVNPLSGGGIANLFSTHPPIAERIEKLESM